MAEPLPLNELFAQVLPSEARSIVVNEMLARTGELSRKAAELNRLLNHVKVPGFRDARRAPRRARTPILIEALQAEPHVAAAVLAVWRERHPDVEASVRAFLVVEGIDNGIPKPYLPVCFPRFPREQLLDLSSRFAASNLDITVPSAAAMIAALAWWPVNVERNAGFEEDDEEVDATDNEVNGEDDDGADEHWADPWGDLLNELEEMDPRHVDWTQASVFADRVLDLARRRVVGIEASERLQREEDENRQQEEQKHREEERAKRSAQMAERIEPWQTLLAFLVLPPPAELAKRIAKLSASDAEERAQAMEARLLSIQELRKAQPATLEEEDTGRSRIKDLRSSLLELIQTLPSEEPLGRAGEESPTGASISSAQDNTEFGLESHVSPAASSSDETDRSPMPDVEEVIPLQAPEEASPLAYAPEESTLAELISAGGPSSMLASQLVTRQCEWLLAGQNLRAYLAAEYIEAQGLTEDGAVPAWLCGLAVLAGDERSHRLDMDLGTDIPVALALRHGLERDQRFFVAWVTVGLLGPAAEWFVPLASNTPTGDLRWVRPSSLDHFCVHRVLGTVRQTQMPPAVGQGRSKESLVAAIRQELNDAASIVDRSANYQNAFVKRCWLQIVGHGGPVMDLLREVRQGRLPDELPTPEQLAAHGAGWERVQARYRANVLNRLQTFVLHLRRALSLRREIAQRELGMSHVLQPDEVAEAIRDGRALASQLRAEGHCAAVGYEVVVGKLESVVSGARR